MQALAQQMQWAHGSADIQDTPFGSQDVQTFCKQPDLVRTFKGRPFHLTLKQF